MAVTISKTVLFTSGEIKFSDLRSSFAETTEGAISASNLLRNTDVNATNPIVPDATENVSISSGTDLRFSQFRNSIKSYAVTQSGTNTELDLSANAVGGNWNGNLNKNIVKQLNITGSCVSTSTGTAALRLDFTIYNLSVFLTSTGRILGAGGAGSATGAGGAGGTAFRLSSNGGQIRLFVSEGGLIYGGGGGGSKGATGATGTTGTCFTITDYTRTVCACDSFRQNNAFCPACDAGDTRLSCSYIQQAASCSFCRTGFRGGIYRGGRYTSTCRKTTPYDVPGAPGGVGGNGGNGEGNGQTRTDGATGAAGTVGGCPTLGGNGNVGENGGNGGTWGNAGGTTGLGAGGAAGASISGLNYIIDSSSDTSGILGPR